jgi:hypothetical protein
MLVLISNEQAQELEHYSNLSGVSVEQLTHEAFSDYIECVISSRSEALARKSGSANLSESARMARRQSRA